MFYNLNTCFLGKQLSSTSDFFAPKIGLMPKFKMKPFSQTIHSNSYKMRRFTSNLNATVMAMLAIGLRVSTDMEVYLARKAVSLTLYFQSVLLIMMRQDR